MVGVEVLLLLVRSSAATVGWWWCAVLRGVVASVDEWCCDVVLCGYYTCALGQAIHVFQHLQLLPVSLHCVSQFVK